MLIKSENLEQFPIWTILIWIILMMRKKKKNRNKRQLKTVYCVLVKGKTEHWYLQFIKKHKELPKISVLLKYKIWGRVIWYQIWSGQDN